MVLSFAADSNCRLLRKCSLGTQQFGLKARKPWWGRVWEVLFQCYRNYSTPYVLQKYMPASFGRLISSLPETNHQLHSGLHPGSAARWTLMRIHWWKKLCVPSLTPWPAKALTISRRCGLQAAALLIWHLTTNSESLKTAEAASHRKLLAFPDSLAYGILINLRSTPLYINITGITQWLPKFVLTTLEDLVLISFLNVWQHFRRDDLVFQLCRATFHNDTHENLSRFWSAPTLFLSPFACKTACSCKTCLQAMLLLIFLNKCSCPNLMATGSLQGPRNAFQKLTSTCLSFGALVKE